MLTSAHNLLSRTVGASPPAFALSLLQYLSSCTDPYIATSYHAPQQVLRPIQPSYSIPQQVLPTSNRPTYFYGQKQPGQPASADSSIRVANSSPVPSVPQGQIIASDYTAGIPTGSPLRTESRASVVSSNSTPSTTSRWRTGGAPAAPLAAPRPSSTVTSMAAPGSIHTHRRTVSDTTSILPTRPPAVSSLPSHATTSRTAMQPTREQTGPSPSRTHTNIPLRHSPVPPIAQIAPRDSRSSSRVQVERASPAPPAIRNPLHIVRGVSASPAPSYHSQEAPPPAYSRSTLRNGFLAPG